MRYKTASLLTVLVLCAFFISCFSPSRAQTSSDEEILFQHDYTLGWLRLALAYDSFQNGDNDTATLRITKRTPDKSISGGLLCLNQQWINGFRGFLRGNDEVFEQEISLKPNARNRLFLFMRGQKRASIRIEIIARQEVQPPTATLSDSAETITYGGSVELSWTTEHADTVTIDPEIGTVGPTGTATVSPAKDTTYTLTAAGPGGVATDAVSIDVQAVAEPLPENSFGQQYEDLIPPNAAIETFDPVRFAVVSGSVTDTAGQPLAGVGITFHGAESLYGAAYTDAAGNFSIPVEGGGLMTIRYHKDGYIEAQRNIQVPWNDIAVAEAVALTTYDTASTLVAPDGNPAHFTVHRSGIVTDQHGSRSVAVVFPGDIKAYREERDGSETELTSFTVRVTEYATPESMPAILPPTSVYTWCGEFTVDGADKVRFSEPVSVWIDNFLNFPVGMTVPVGYYDRDKAVWGASENGVIVELLDTDGDALVDALDADGDGQPDDLDGDELFLDEIKGREDAQPGAVFMLARIGHFSPWDCNFPVWLPADAAAPKGTPPPPECPPCKNTVGSFVSHRDQVYHKDVAIPGTDVSIYYASNRAAGYKQRIDIPVSDGTLPESCKVIRLRVCVAGKLYERELPPQKNLVETIIWDGLDLRGNPAPNATAQVEIGYVYDATYAIPADEAYAFGIPGTGGTSVLVRDFYVPRTSYQFPLQDKAPAMNDVGNGWTLATHHRLDTVKTDRLYKGDGGVLEQQTDIIDFVDDFDNYENLQPKGFAIAPDGMY